MPQKANAGNQFERIRIATNDVLGQMTTALFSFKNEPVQDVLPVYRADQYALQGLCHLEKALGLFRHILPKVTPRKERMWQLLREGYSGAPDLAITLIRNKGFGGRCAHRIVATMVRIARGRGIKPYACTGTLLDEAARARRWPSVRAAGPWNPRSQTWPRSRTRRISRASWRVCTHERGRSRTGAVRLRPQRAGCFRWASTRRKRYVAQVTM